MFADFVDGPNTLPTPKQAIMQQTTALKTSTAGIRQRNNTPIGQTSPHITQSLNDDPFETDAAPMSTARAIIITISLLGVICFSALATLFNARYPFFAFHGNMEDAASSCWQTVALFAIIAIIAIFPSFANIYSSRQKAKALQKEHVLPGAYRR